ncbi:MAG: tetratricopeptide repeat protein [Pirellulales bacterium]
MIALIALDRIGQIHIDVNWLDEVGEAYLDLHGPVRPAMKKERSEHLRRFPMNMNSPRDSPDARGVVLTPRDYEQRMKDRLLAEVQANRASHLRMLMNQIDEEHSPRVREIALQHQATLGESFVRLVTTRCLMVENRWNEAYEELQSLCRKLPQVEELWRDSAEVLEQLGRVDDARLALERALDINPEDPGLYQVLVKLQESSLSYGEQRKEILQAAEGRKHQRGYYPSLVSLFAREGLMTSSMNIV